VRRTTCVEDTERRLTRSSTASTKTLLAIRSDAGNTSKRIPIGLSTSVAGVTPQSKYEQNQNQGRGGQDTNESEAGIPW